MQAAAGGKRWQTKESHSNYYPRGKKIDRETSRMGSNDSFSSFGHPGPTCNPSIREVANHKTGFKMNFTVLTNQNPDKAWLWSMDPKKRNPSEKYVQKAVKNC